MHHLYFNYNYGQFTTLWDRLGGSYRKPNAELFVKETKMAADEWNRQVVEMEKLVKEVEGKDDSTGEPLIQRKDDNEEALRTRLGAFHTQAKPILEHYKAVVAHVDATKNIEHVYNQVSAALGPKV